MKINKKALQEVYDIIKSTEPKYDALRKAVSELHPDFFIDIYAPNAFTEMSKIAYNVILHDDASFIDDFEYLLYEVPNMGMGHGLIEVGTKDYEIENFDDLWKYWNEVYNITDI